ncbi:hypothetical protein SAMN04487831_11745 [Pseudobutyrivibrio sp. UC1225]|uniref:4-fold beta flower protein n=1 Tax=Pseudobutyrivibrio sp. UC1225 TaxID=1798185 RepID=UPI0008F2A02F|nr:hypothetical protein [Pseudobutyrivibrio sp. UC1225]SFO29965.1 hypothetical protein SAMN04487831_11745 [Pseudobutyrivibrio sp. UC1225]
MIFYDSHGRPIAYTEDAKHIFLFNGRPVAYLHNDLVYSFHGKQLGRINNGWVRDLHGGCVFFTEVAQGGGPAKPAKHTTPAKGAKYALPAKAARHAPFAKAANSLSWSRLSGIQFFDFDL